MITAPRFRQYKKQQKGRPVNKVNKVFTLEILKTGSFFLRTLESGRLNSKQLETLYYSLNKYIKKSGKIILKVFPHTPISKKPIEVRMGKGKGNVAFWVAKIKAGTILCEVISSFRSIALAALICAQQKLPLKTKICNL